MYRPILARINAIHTCYASAVVYLMLLCIDARSLALFSAEAAVTTLFCINYRCKEAESREEAQNGSYRADCVAPCPAMLPCKDENYHESKYSYCER